MEERGEDQRILGLLLRFVKFRIELVQEFTRLLERQAHRHLGAAEAPLVGELVERALHFVEHRRVQAARQTRRRELRRYARTLLRASPPDSSVRGIHRFRRATEPWALHALAYVGASELAGPVEVARREEPAEPLLRGGELELPPGPEIGRILAAIDEERAAGTISTREEALALARRLAEEGPS